MPLRTTTNFDTENAKAVKTPVWTVEFDSIATLFSSGEFSGITASYKKHMGALSVQSPRVDLLTFQTELYGIEFEIKNIDDTIRGLFTNSFIGREVTVKVGYSDLAIADFSTLPIMYIVDYGIKQDLQTYFFKARQKIFIDKPIFQSLGVTDLTVNLPIATLTATVTSTTSFQAPASAPWGDNAGTYIIIDDEIMLYDTGTATTFATLTRGQLGTIEADHIIGAEVREIMRLQSLHDLGMQILLEVMMTSGPSSTIYDIALDFWGLGLTEDDIDINQFQNELEEKWGATGDSRELIIDSKNGVSDGFAWIEQNILKQIPAYFILTDEGKLGIKAWDVIGAKEGNFNLTTSNIVSNPNLLIESSKVLTHIQIYSELNRATGIYGTRKEYELDDVDDEIGEQIKQVVNFDTASTLTGGGAVVTRFLEKSFGRLGNPYIRTRLTSNMQSQTLLLGDKVNLTYNKLPDLSDGSSTWDEEGCEVINTRVNYQLGQILNTIECDNIQTREIATIQTINVVDEDEIDQTDLTEDTNHAEGAITVFADAGGGQVTVTSASNGLSNGDVVIITDTTNYNGTFTVANVAANTFEITDTWVADDATGAWIQNTDAYYDNSTYAATNIMVQIEFDLPANGAGEERGEYIELYIKIQSPVGTDDIEELKKIYFNETGSGKQITQLYVLNLTSAVYERVRVDWTGASVAVDRPTNVKMTRVKFWDIDIGNETTETNI